MFNSQNHEMVVNISTNQPVFQVRGLSSGTEYRVRIYSVNDNGGVSEQTAIDTYTLQVRPFKSYTADILNHQKEKFVGE